MLFDAPERRPGCAATASARLVAVPLRHSIFYGRLVSKQIWCTVILDGRPGVCADRDRRASGKAGRDASLWPAAGSESSSFFVCLQMLHLSQQLVYFRSRYSAPCRHQLFFNYKYYACHTLIYQSNFIFIFNHKCHWECPSRRPNMIYLKHDILYILPIRLNQNTL